MNPHISEVNEVCRDVFVGCVCSRDADHETEWHFCHCGLAWRWATYKCFPLNDEAVGFRQHEDIAADLSKFMDPADHPDVFPTVEEEFGPCNCAKHMEVES